jgi:hypothetical protein
MIPSTQKMDSNKVLSTVFCLQFQEILNQTTSFFVYASGYASCVSGHDLIEVIPSAEVNKPLER